MVSGDGHDTNEDTPAVRYHRNGVDLGRDSEKPEEFRKAVTMAAAGSIPCAFWQPIAPRNSRACGWESEGKQCLVK
jgi:hypothetical protein